MGKSNESVEFERHEPERRHATGGRVLCNGGCCCCSCCLHSLGGLVGAALASRKEKASTGSSIVGLYWAVLAFLALATFALMSFGGVSVGVITVLLLLPVIQLAASLISWIWLVKQSDRFLDPDASARILGRITLHSFVGALIGLFAMVLGLAALK